MTIRIVLVLVGTFDNSIALMVMISGILLLFGAVAASTVGL